MDTQTQTDDIADMSVFIFFGRKSFFMRANTGIYKVEKGQKLVGSCHLAQRDLRVFGVPGCKDVNEFDPTRFKNKVSGQIFH